MNAALPQPTPEQEMAGSDCACALQAAGKSGDAWAKIEAAGALLDWQLSVGLLTRDELREMAAPNLLEMIGQLDDIPEGRQCLTRIRNESLKLLNGPDYAERAAAALFIVTMDAVQRPRQAKASAAHDKICKREWRDELVCMQDSAEDVAPLLWGRAYIVEDGAEPDPEAPEFREALAHVRCMHQSAGILLRRMGYQSEPVTAFMRAPAEVSE